MSFLLVTKLKDIPEWVPDWGKDMWYGNLVYDWLYSLTIIIGSIILAKILYWFIGKYVKRLTAKTKTDLDDILIDKLEEPIVYAIVISAFYWAFKRLHFTENIDAFFLKVFTVIYILNFTWLFVRIVDSFIEEYVVPMVEKSDSELDDQLLPILRKVLKAIIWIVGLIIGLSNAGFDVMALVAGLGIGGLALALAAQDTVKNIFGGIMIFLDKPFKMKDRIKISGMDGFVEEIGIRSTRIRTLEGRLITVPNGQFSDNPVENVSMEPTRKVVLNLGLTYETTPENMEKAMQLLADITNENPKVEDDPLISFNSWGDFAMGILFIYYIKHEDHILSAQTEMNLEILKQFNAAGLEFAYPTQLVYKKDIK
jgi:MscS family membrane protein